MLQRDVEILNHEFFFFFFFGKKNSFFINSRKSFFAQVFIFKIRACLSKSAKNYTWTHCGFNHYKSRSDEDPYDRKLIDSVI